MLRTSLFRGLKQLHCLKQLHYRLYGMISPHPMEMEMEMKIVSIETIKPASPTPLHLKKFGLSSFDQFAQNTYTPIVFFYPAGTESSAEQRIQRLKQSLSEVLVRFYPVAGSVIKDELYVNCNDRGVDFSEAKVNCLSLSDVLRRPDHKVLKKLLPPSTMERVGDRLLQVQANVFECGGIAIGASFGHKIMDGCAMSGFLKGWAALARGDLNLPKLDLNAVASHFPVIPITNICVPPIEFDFSKVTVSHTSRFLFSGAKIASLRDKVSNVSAERPTRVASVMAVVWKCVVKTWTMKLRNEARLSILAQWINLRGRLHPPLLDNSLGNILGVAFAESHKCNDVVDKLQGLVGELRRVVTDAKENYLKKLENPEEAITTIGEGLKKLSILRTRDDIDLFVCSSVCRFGWYETDFGWGKPVWFGVVSDDKNSLVMVDTRDGDGIEVCVTLAEEDMDAFATDPELLEYASLNPNMCP